MKKDQIMQMNHLNEVKMTYFQHLIFAFKIVVVLVITAVILMVHAILPFVLVDTASTIIYHLNKILNDSKSKPKA
jgi:hypothetical protein